MLHSHLTRKFVRALVGSACCAILLANTRTNCQSGDQGQAAAAVATITQESAPEHHLRLEFGSVSLDDAESTQSLSSMGSRLGSSAAMAKMSLRLPSFERFQKMFRKSYRSPREHLFRFSRFLASLLRAARSQLAYLRQKVSFFLAINQFSDLTPEERRRRVGVQAPTESPSSPPEGANPRVKRSLWSAVSERGQAGPVDTDIDWRREEPGGTCLPPPGEDQGDCGCCYALAILKLLEWDHCRQFAAASPAASGRPRPVKFSAQYIIDCGRPFGLQGCERGNPAGTLEFIKAAGLLEEARMPYVGEERECAAGRPEVAQSVRTPDGNEGGAAATGRPALSANGGELISKQRRHAAALVPKRVSYQALRVSHQWLEGLREQPLVVYLHLTDEFFDYGGGVYEARERCDQQLGHFMLLAGRGRDPKTRQPYWLLSNSFGEHFGESGYVRLLAESRDPKGKSDYRTNCLLYALKARAEF